MTYFDSPTAAARYAAGRPAYHALVIDRVRARLGLRSPLVRALDVGCGTGLSTVALRAIAGRVIGVDRSAHMLGLAQPAAGISYLQARAESLPFPARYFDCLTLAQAFHWLHRDTFLAEARRVLVPGAWLVVYDNYFTGRMAGNPGFVTWLTEHYAVRYPRPPRGQLNFGPAEAQPAGFSLVGEETYQNDVHFTLPKLVDYLTTHSNVIAVVEGGQEPLASARAWLTTGLQPFFAAAPEAAFTFSGPIWYLRNA